ncbi:MAG: ABC transporter ATP-binding protein [Lentisphaerae bacterium]|nr:ABC transporter ATP-binding protein [Lentisphaerota bacterium]
MLSVQDLTVQFNTDDGILNAATNVSFTLQDGKTLGLVGESGCGKSVSAMSIPRLIPQPPGIIKSGKIELDGIDLLQLPIKEMQRIRGRQIGMIFQEPMTALSPLHTVGNQLAEVVNLHTRQSSEQVRELCLDWIRKVGIPDAEKRFDSYPHELSGGMRQRVVIAMAMIMQPKLVIADEPTTALDVTIQAQILDLMRKIKDNNASLLLITHDMGVIWEMCDDMVVMYASRVVESGPVKEIFAHPRHPYTQGLLNSIPALAKGSGKLPHIPGQVPSLLNLPRGCAFADRCPHVTEVCRNEVPKMTADGARQVACFNPL